MDTYPILYMLCGLPASGKSTYAKKLSDETGARIFSSDAIRKELVGNSVSEEANTPEFNRKVFDILHSRIIEELRNKRPAIYDATNIRSMNRRAFLDSLEDIKCKKCCIIVARIYEKCLLNNKFRDDVVPDDVIKRMYFNWNTPYYAEGWDEIMLYYTDKDNGLYGTCEDICKKYNTYDLQDSRYSLTLGDHMKRTYDKLFELDDKDNLNIKQAALIHDLGKVYTRTFKDSQDNVIKEANYHNHENVGAYESLFVKFENKVDPLYVSILINNHMVLKDFMTLKDQTVINKIMYEEYAKTFYEQCKGLWGQKLFEDLMLLCKADILSY